MGLKLEEIRNRTLQKNNTDIKSQDTKNCNFYFNFLNFQKPTKKKKKYIYSSLLK